MKTKEEILNYINFLRTKEERYISNDDWTYILKWVLEDENKRKKDLK